MLAGGLLGAAPARAQFGSHRLDVFVVAHADDWQLFMGDALVHALRREHPVLVIVTNAGDAARGPEFWHTREEGAVASLQAAQALAGVVRRSPACASWGVPGMAPSAPGALRAARPTRDGERIVYRCHTSGATTVFLRLPDGRPDGNGFAVHGFRSLLRLANTGLGPLVALDSSTSYAGLPDITQTVVALVRGHQRLGLSVHVHTHDPELLSNPLDHADHRVTGRIALEAARALHAGATLYAGYSNVRRADNLTPEAAAWKAYCFVAYDRAMMRVHGSWSAYAENAWGHAQYLFRTYARPAGSSGLVRYGWP